MHGGALIRDTAYFLALINPASTIFLMVLSGCATRITEVINTTQTAGG